MKVMRVFAFVGVILAAVMVMAGSAFAIPSVGDSIYFGDGPGSPGGEFYAKTYSGGQLTSSFITFCLEGNEYLSFGVEYKIAGITEYATAGGLSGATDGKDYICSETAYLYSNFAHGTLAGYAHDATHANALQRAIWYYEGEGPNGVILQYSDLTGLAKDYADLASTSANGTLYGVKVLNIVDRWGNPKQDQLYVPEPGTLLLLGFGFFALGAAAHARRRS